ncbi:ABC transporter substrate binding protein [Clostridium novyi]|uniref:ABC transporter substrate binding protein n=1 Tax=Clostridium novyi TaxID=1542 RepID=UPI0004D5002D|nr:ABC transporter substrate binding protein [Clostridium novyi]KEH86263.1 diguanylate cyclase [Clostridium novyi A str. 4540]KEH92266.1 diguanylate cyclase [Clostridium novyi A str. GD211209]
MEEEFLKRTNNKILKIFIYFIIVFCVFMCKTYIVYSLDYKNVLILNSYDEGFKWTRHMERGIYDVLNNQYDIHLFHEYMDTKNINNAEYIDMLTKLYIKKYENKKIDLIICCDNDALNFILSSKIKFLNSCPLVFCGINEFSDDLIKNKKNCTGVVEKIDVDSTISSIFTMQPNTKNIVVVTDSSTTGKSNEESAKKVISKYKERVNVYFCKDITQKEFYNKLKGLSSDTVILYIGQFRDDNYDVIPFSKSGKILEKCKYPIYVCWDFLFEKNVVGGKVISGYDQGLVAGNMASKILRGINVKNVPIMRNCPSNYVFNYNELVKHNIKLNNLPKNSTIVNRPYSFIYEYKRYIVAVSSLIFILTTFIIILSINIRKRIESEKKLKENYIALEKSKETLEKGRQKYKLVVDGSNDAIWEWDIKEDKLFMSNKLNIIKGSSKYTDINENKRYFSKIIKEEDYKKIIEKFKEILYKNENYIDVECRILDEFNYENWFNIKGKALRDGEGNVLKIAGSITDITDRKEAIKKIEYLAYNDSLTGLPNRVAYSRDIYGIIQNVKKDNKIGAIMFLDIDNFKNVNDTLGHDYGNELLKKVNKRISNILTEDERFYRLGGDEFIIVQCGSYNEKDIELLADNILKLFSKSFIVKNEHIYTTVSLGISFFPKDSCDQSVLLKYADTAMYSAKNLGKSKYLIYNKEMSSNLIRRSQLEEGLRHAIERKELKLVFQPQVNANTGEIKGVEVLLRWNSEKFGFVSPSEFIVIAEKSGLINSIGEWVLRESCLKRKQWQIENLKDITISVNVSVIQLQQDDFIEKLKEILEKTKLPPECLELEITESVMMESKETNLDILNSIRDIGVKIALDDFGTGYSSLSYLKMLPINKIKLDKSFIDTIHINKNDKFIVEGIIDLAHKIGLNVIAEGVELNEQLDVLCEANCDEIQGYYFSKPVEEFEFKELLKKGYIDR